MEAIILAGGLGTRLRSEVSDVPKPMAPIQGRPFMEYLVDQLKSQGFNRIIFSVGHKSEIIENHFGHEYNDCEILYAKENKRLGTGGAIMNAMQFCQRENVLVVNGDSIFLTDLQEQMSLHHKSKASVTLALKPMENVERYGTVDMNQQGRVISFNEKQPLSYGLINTGTYIFDIKMLRDQNLPEVFSIEKDFFETRIDQLDFRGYVSDGYFLDIGIPEDFKKAQYEIGLFPMIDKEWTLFLDRDGVINEKRDNDYVKNLDELVILPGAVSAIANLSHIFARIIIVTNQQGIGKELMSKDDLQLIHQHIIHTVQNRGGRIDAILHAPQLVSEQSSMRKPGIGMALQAKKLFPDINFKKSIMVGDSSSDMEFARNAGMWPVFLGNREDVYKVRSLSQLTRTLLQLLD